MTTVMIDNVGSINPNAAYATQDPCQLTTIPPTTPCRERLEIE